jgi:hypothetical protein
MTHTHSRLSSDVCVFSIFRTTSDKTTHQTWRKRLIKLDKSDSSNLTKATRQTWRKNVISLNLTKASSHQIWRKRHLIKSDESVISSNLTSVRVLHQTGLSKVHQRIELNLIELDLPAFHTHIKSLYSRFSFFFS